MELDLGLALPISSYFPTKMSDVHRDHHHFDCVENAGMSTLEFKNLMMKDPNKKKKKKKKRSFDNAIEDREEEDQQQVENKTLSLLVWSGHRPNKDGDDEEEDRESRSDMMNGDDEEEGIVGWPPIGTYRKRLLDGDGYRRQRIGVNGGGGSDDRSSIFVKVRMEGVMIGRKIDLMLFDSYQSLTNSLLNMFAKYYKKGENENGGQEPYILSYLDKEGDWLLAGDVPWEPFIDSVQRMEILKQRA